MTKFLTQVNNLVWGMPLILLLLGTGIYFTTHLKFIQFVRLKKAFSLIFKKNENHEGDVSSFQALCTALSSTIGTGNIVGVATAISAGGPGALFWMWISAFFGMATKYAEGVLAIKYRTKDENGQIAGGPMYYIEKGLHNKFLATLFAFFGVAVAYLGIGTFTQVRSISDALHLSFHVPYWISAIILTLLVGFITIGGIHRIAAVAEKVIPFMCVFYISGVVLILLTHLPMIPHVLKIVLASAFDIKAVFGARMAERLPPSGVCKAGTAPERRRAQLAGGEVCRHRLLRKRKKHPEPCRSQSGSRRQPGAFYRVTACSSASVGCPAAEE